MLCELRTTKFCSPFVHYYTNQTNSSVEFGDLHGRNHVDSEWVRKRVVPDAKFDFQVQVPVQVNDPGLFSVIAGLLFFLSDISTFPEPIYLGSVAAIPSNALEQILEFRNEPLILTTSNRALITSYVFIGLAGTVMLFLMFQLFIHRKDQVITLSQGKFLLGMCFFGLIAMVGSINFNPKNDLYCNLMGPLLLVPLHIFYSIILGRLWRINAIISPLLLLTLEREDTWSRKCVEWLSKMTTCRDHRQLRRTVTDAQLARVILLWASPQIILQVCNWLLNPDQAVIVFTEDLTKGSVVCSGIQNNGVPEVLSGVLLVIQFVAIWRFARQSQDLPSLFNEAAVIFNVTLVSVIILAVATIVVIMTSGPSTSPSVQYIIRVLGTQAMLLNASVKLVLPKLQMVWRGEAVVVTKLIADHQKKQRKKSSLILYTEDDLPIDPKTMGKTDDDSSDSSSVVLVHTTAGEEESLGFSALNGNEDNGDDTDDFKRTCITGKHPSIPLDPITEAFDSINSIAFDLSKIREKDQSQSAPNSGEFLKRPTLVASAHSVHEIIRSKRIIVAGKEPSKSKRHLPGGFKSMRNNMRNVLGSVGNLAADAAIGGGKSTGSREGEKFEIEYHPETEEKIVISEKEPPSRRLLLRMIDVQRLLKQVNTTLTAGSAVPRDEWELLRKATIELGGVFHDNVEFEWDMDQQNGSRYEPTAGGSTPRRRRSSSTSNASRQGRVIVEKWGNL